ncbi:MAG: response regulator [Saprospiraceae bacterium]|nr:response regulator [Saprospiraceae bacterium]
MAEINLIQQAQQIVKDPDNQSIRDIAQLLYQLNLSSFQETEQELISDIKQLLKAKRRQDQATRKFTWLPVKNGQLSIGGRPSLPLVELLKAQNCHVIITLLEQSKQRSAEEIGNKAIALGMEWIWCPLSASDLPRGEDLIKVQKIMGQLEERLADGQNLFIHCAAGIHRTGAFTHGLLRFMGYNTEKSKQTISDLRAVTAREAQEKHWHWGEQFGTTYNKVNVKKRLRILLVDDEPYFRRTFRTVLPFILGDDTIIDDTGDGEIAISLMIKNRYDLVFSDIRRSRLQGIPMFEKMKELNIQSPIIFISGVANSFTLNSLVENGALAGMSKPVNLTDLQNLLHSLMPQILAKKLLYEKHH